MTDTAPSTPMTVGGYVQYNATTQNPLAPAPSPDECTIGIVRQLFSAQGKQYAQVVWNPGGARPKTGLYTCDQLCPMSQQDATAAVNAMNEGTYEPPTGALGSNFQQPSVPTLALPPALQGQNVTPTLNQPTNEPLSPGAGYQ